MEQGRGQGGGNGRADLGDSSTRRIAAGLVGSTFGGDARGGRWGWSPGREEAEAEAWRAAPPTLQMGKIAEDHFSLDFGWPLSPFQAFVVAMGLFDG
ncbi:unnamed protein product [Discosporangium mesarthrocarpum]